MEDCTVYKTIALPAIAGLFTDFNESDRVKNRCKGQVRLAIGLKKKNAKKRRNTAVRCHSSLCHLLSIGGITYGRGARSEITDEKTHALGKLHAIGTDCTKRETFVLRVINMFLSFPADWHSDDLYNNEKRGKRKPIPREAG